MDEGPSNTSVTELPPESSSADRGHGARAERKAAQLTFPTLRLDTLQEMSPAALQELFAAAELRTHPGRSRHQLIFDLMRVSRWARTNGADQRLFGTA